jgi:flagellar hook assembly protein FlgD
VDFSPLKGGVIPTGDADGALALTGAAAASVSGGAETAFSLSAPATVTVEVLNLAGRVVAAPVIDRPTSAGLQRVLWTGLSQQGTAAPAGRYLVRISAAAPSGELRSAVAPLTLSPRW